MSAEATLARFREYMVGPTRFMNLLSCFELGVIDAIRETPGITAIELGAVAGVKPDAVEQLLFLLVKEGFVAYGGATGGYSLDALADVADADLGRVLTQMNMIKVTTLRQLFYLSDSVRTGTLVGLKPSPGLRVTTFDLPVKEEQCLRNFRDHGVEDQCSFIGGDIFKGVPKGFDVVLIKHFLDMFDKSEVLKILDAVNQSLDVGAQVNILVPVYPENIKDSDNYTVDFFPTFFLGCSMAQGGPQKLSTYRSWLEESGFTVTKAISKDPAELPPDAIPVQGILCATKNA
jgi:hypothetical protein